MLDHSRHDINPASAVRPPASALRLVIVVATRLYRQGLGSVLSDRPDIELVASLACCDGGVSACVDARADVVILDSNLQGRTDFLRALKAALPRVTVVALSVPRRSDDILKLAEAGIAGFVTEDASLTDLIDSLSLARAGRFPCDARVSAALARRVACLSGGRPVATSGTPLTERETEIVTLIDRGLGNKEIARRLHISLSTVKNHVHRVLAKLEVRNRMQAAAKARNAGLLSR